MRSFIHGKLTLLVFFLFFSCVSEQVEPQIDCSTTPLELSIDQNDAASCGNDDGSFSIAVAGGEAPYSFESSLGNNSTGSYADIGAGVYTVEVIDAKGCTNTIDVSVQNQEGVSIDQISLEDSGCGTSQGQIDVSVSGGIQPYSFSLNGNASQSSGLFTGLASGSYILEVEDSEGCEITQEVLLTSGVSFESSVSSIIATNCAVSGCHNGSVSPNLSTLDGIQSRAERVKARTGNGTMPPSGSLSQADIDLIACWVDDGALEN